MLWSSFLCIYLFHCVRWKTWLIVIHTFFCFIYLNITEYCWNIFKYFFIYSRLSSFETKFRGIIFSKISEKPLKLSKYHATRKNRNIFILRYGIKTAHSAAGALFARCSQENAISSRWKSLNGAECNLFIYTR